MFCIGFIIIDGNNPRIINEMAKINIGMSNFFGSLIEISSFGFLEYMILISRNKYAV